MKKFLKITRIFFSLSLLVSSSNSFAAAFLYSLMNSADSSRNPITITNAQASAKSNYPGCQATKQITDLKVTTGQEQVISYDPQLPASCYDQTADGAVVSNLYITLVDGKNMQKGSCELEFAYAYDSNGTYWGGAVKITETNDRFYCEYPLGALKDK